MSVRGALGPYRSVLRTPGAARFAVPGFVGRLPVAMLGLGTVLMLVATTGSYALAGAVSATLAVGQALAAPTLGRLADRMGHRRVLAPQLAVHAAALVALIVAAEVPGPTWTLFAAAALTGAAIPQLGAFVRVRWTGLLDGTPRLETAYVFVALGAVFGAVEVAMVAFAREQGAPAAAGVLIALFAAGSLAAGVAYGTVRWRAAPTTRFRLAVAALALGVVPLALSPTVPVMAVAITVAGLAIAPSLIAGNSLAHRLVPASSLNEGFTWLSIALFLGVAVGAPAAGAVVDAAGARPAIAVAVGAGVVAALLAACSSRALATPVAAS